MNVYELKDNRMVCWDDFLVESFDNSEVRMHKPQKREKVFTTNAKWEGCDCGYQRLLKLGDKYRLYYRALDFYVYEDGSVDWGTITWCVAESTDGLKSFKRLPINKYTYKGIKENNIFFPMERDNFAIMYDENPDCPKEEKFKALSMIGGHEEGGHGLGLYVSEDGIDFNFKKRLAIPGSFDSYNIIVWDNDRKKYFIYYRGEHRVDFGDIEFDVLQKAREIHREVRVCTTTDFENFEFFGELDYKGNEFPMQYYTNQVHKYHRAKDMFIGFPARYIEHWDDDENYEQMGLPDYKATVIKYLGRSGNVVTDCAVITSRDGVHFDKWDEAFLTPGIESRNNWWYGNCFTTYGMVETPSDTEGAPNEISFLNSDNALVADNEVYRYTIRLDGFFSWYAKYKGGSVLTKPFTFEGNELEVNFSTSALGGMKVVVCDEDGNTIEGYESNNIFGDSVDRKVKFQKDIKELEGKTIRLKFTLRDCDLYSFKFNK